MKKILDKQKLRDLGTEISLQAGRAIMEIYKQDDFSISMKGDDSPLTAADLASHHVIVGGLDRLNRELGLNIPILSEESREVSFSKRVNWSMYWLIDPLDGTKEFIKRNGEFTVNIALIEESVPVIGFVYVPVKDELYYGDMKERFACRVEFASDVDKSHTEQIFASESLNGTVHIVASKSHLNEETQTVINGIEKEFGKCQLLSSGSSLKLCRVAEGQADLYPRYALTMEWDTAAADAVCRAAGCSVLNALNHKPLEYNKENLLNPFFYVTANTNIKRFLENL